MSGLPHSSSSLKLEAAAHEAALEDGLISTNSAGVVIESKVKKMGLRRGKWTSEEEHYANRLIYEFKMGLLPLTDGTTLRTFLSKLLNCDPMRISKKFVGQNCIGKVGFLFSISSKLSTHNIWRFGVFSKFFDGGNKNLIS